MITIVIHKDNADFYRSIDENPETYYPEPMDNDGDDWVELTIDDEESTDFYEIANKYGMNINDIIAVGYEDEHEEIQYKLSN